MLRPASAPTPKSREFQRAKAMRLHSVSVMANAVYPKAFSCYANCCHSRGRGARHRAFRASASSEHPPGHLPGFQCSLNPPAVVHQEIVDRVGVVAMPDSEGGDSKLGLAEMRLQHCIHARVLHICEARTACEGRLRCVYLIDRRDPDPIRGRAEITLMNIDHVTSTVEVR